MVQFRRSKRSGFINGHIATKLFLIFCYFWTTLWKLARGRKRRELVRQCAELGTTYDDFTVDPKTRQGLQHWAYMLTKEDFDQVVADYDANGWPTGPVGDNNGALNQQRNKKQKQRNQSPNKVYQQFLESSPICNLAQQTKAKGSKCCRLPPKWHSCHVRLMFRNKLYSTEFFKIVISLPRPTACPVLTVP